MFKEVHILGFCLCVLAQHTVYSKDRRCGILVQVVGRIGYLLDIILERQKTIDMTFQYLVKEIWGENKQKKQ